MNITTRLSAGSYVARAKGHKATASSAESARRAAENLAGKLGHSPDLVELESEIDGISTFSVPEVSDAQ
ncbi:TPA: hypothetical protein L4T48_000757 [Pseudomonas aeruginosa]|nr:hypothetical protein [Pseudomonas aeruginosa]